jgi:hypothetical protein
MNCGAQIARGDYLVFMHADSRSCKDMVDVIRCSLPMTTQSRLSQEVDLEPFLECLWGPPPGVPLASCNLFPAFPKLVAQLLLFSHVFLIERVCIAFGGSIFEHLNRFLLHCPLHVCMHMPAQVNFYSWAKSCMMVLCFPMPVLSSCLHVHVPR